MRDVVAVAGEHVESIELHHGIVLARMQRVEIGNAVDVADAAGTPYLVRWEAIGPFPRAAALGEQFGTRLGELHKGAALMHHELAALDCEPQAGAILGRRGALLVEKRRVDLLDMDTAILHRLDRAGDLDQFAGGFFRVGVDTGFGEFHWLGRINPVGWCRSG
jgi:hypothetical protein